MTPRSASGAVVGEPTLVAGAVEVDVAAVEDVGVGVDVSIAPDSVEHEVANAPDSATTAASVRTMSP
jgi:hypothetical protein